MNQTRTLLALLLMIFSGTCYSQGLYKVELAEKVSASTLIIEGRVLSSRSFWNDAHTMIYTANTVQPYKVFKGIATGEQLEILTVGGQVDETVITASELLTLEAGNTGVFFCHPNTTGLRSPQSGKTLLDVYSSAQGFIKYDLSRQRAGAPFAIYEDVTGSLYPLLRSSTGRSYTDLEPSFDVRSFRAGTAARGEAPLITSFSPATVVAGKFVASASNVLIITGSGFGLPGGSARISFNDADDGVAGVPYDIPSTSDQVISWTDLQIKVRVPARAGTGTFDVWDAGNVGAPSPTPLNVSYAILSGSFGAVPTSRMYTLLNRNGIGGYSYYYSTNTANSGVDFSTSPSEPPFARAITTWQEVAGLNFSYGGTSTSQTVNPQDALNLIMLDNTGTGVAVLPAGVLAICYSSGSSCIDSSFLFRLGFEIVIRNQGVSTGSVSFNNGPCKTSTSVIETDMESVILHELGHALNLAHIIDPYEGGSLATLNPQKVMNFNIVNGSDRRSPDWSALTGARYNINPRGLVYGCVANGEMIPLPVTLEAKDDCPLVFPSSPTSDGTSVTFDLNHSTSNKFADPQYTAVTTTGLGTSLTNNAFYVVRTKNNGSLNLVVSNYSTVPASQSACSGAGVELSIYQVNSCPAGQAFPAPIAYRTFNANGSITPVTGLTANTNYLLMADGLSNTRAVFSVGLLGSALPLIFVDFRGTKKESAVLLDWITGSEFNNDRFEIETSKDGTTFYKIGVVMSLGDHEENTPYSFTDQLPAPGQNYYRIRQVDKDGRSTYSKTISVEYQSGAAVRLFPNPAGNQLQLLLSEPAANLGVSIYAINGTLLRTLSASSVTRQYTVDLAGIAAGVYIIEIRTDKAGQQSRFIRR